MIRITALPSGQISTVHDGTAYQAQDLTTILRTLAALGIDGPWELRRESGKLIRAGRSVREGL